MNIAERYMAIRKHTEEICKPLQTEDFVVQPSAEVSPPKWHLGHSSWFFETFILIPFLSGYRVFDAQYNFVFNSYYETIGNRVIRTDRGNLSRSSVADVYQYREYVDFHVLRLLSFDIDTQVHELVILGLNHEQQHQELLLTDIKYILGNNPLFPPYDADKEEYRNSNNAQQTFITIPEGIYEIGYDQDGFCYDNELGRHKVYLSGFSISAILVTNDQYISFMESGGYQDFSFWHAEGWDWVNSNKIAAPLYWFKIDGLWYNYTLSGLKPVVLEEPVSHISYYEAYAFASFSGMRLPTEFEWEASSGSLNWGERWEWTESAYLPYPRFSKQDGAIGEYNGKFMVNQKVLRGASVATPVGHSRETYRNFFHPDLRWQYTGIRLVK